jgi:hypothetical protein
MDKNDPKTVRMIKTYSVLQDTVMKIKEIGEFKGEYDATVLRDAVDLYYAQVFPSEEQPVKDV